MKKLLAMYLVFMNIIVLIGFMVFPFIAASMGEIGLWLCLLELLLMPLVIYAQNPIRNFINKLS